MGAVHSLDLASCLIVERQKLRCYNGGMTISIASLSTITDAKLLTAVTHAAAQERTTTAHLIALLAELDSRRLYLGEGCSSLFTYCTQVLRLSEHAAYRRIEAARCARRFPVILDQLTEGAITLTTIGVLAPHLTSENVQEVLSAARHKTKRDIERLVATLRPLPPVPPTVRKLPAPAQGVSGRRASEREQSARDHHKSDGFGNGGGDSLLSGAPTVDHRPRHSATVTPLAPERYKLQVTLSLEAHGKLRRAQDLLRHAIPSGDLGAILDRALTLLVADLEKTRLAATTRPRAAGKPTRGSRHVPAAVKRRVWARDQGQCAFVGTQGRCTERALLEIHHVVPFAAGGPTIAENLELRCRRHNAYEAAQFFGSLLTREAQAHYSVQAGEVPTARSPSNSDRVNVQTCYGRTTGEEAELS